MENRFRFFTLLVSVDGIITEKAMAMRTTAFSLTLILSTSPVFADAIDGDWCNRNGAHLHIAGPAITLGAGQIIMGKYGRHAFSYIAPKGDPEFGAEVMFVLRSETEMRRVRDPMAMPEHDDLWQRCETISLTNSRLILGQAASNS